VLGNARGKARDVARREGVPPGGAVLAADTEVVLDGRTLGQPADAGAARAMLRRLSGRAHHVMTGVAVIGADGVLREGVEVTEVRFRALDEDTLRWYLATGEWRGRAGGYAVQGAGAALVAAVAGDHTGVVGLPLGLTLDLLAAAGVNPLGAAGTG
jgi:septum formation protein